MINSAKITVIVPIHRVEHSFLNQCLSTLRSQTLKEFEAILILNDSTNNEKETAEKFCAEDSRFKLFETNIADVSTARNIGLDHAQGKYITFLDCDDWFSNDALQTLFDLMEQNQIEIGLANAQKILGNGKQKKLFDFYNHTEATSLKHISHTGVWSYIFQNNIIRENGFRFQEGLKLSEDRVFLFEYYLHCKKIAFTDKTVYFYRQHASSVCNSKQTHEHAIQQIKAAIALREILANSPEFSQRDICHLERFLTRMGMVAYIKSGTTKDGISQLKTYFLNNICNSRPTFYYCWYRAKLSSLAGKFLHL